MLCSDSTIEYCGRFCAAAVEASHEAQLHLNASTVRYNLVGAKVDGAGQLHINFSHMRHNYFCQVHDRVACHVA